MRELRSECGGRGRGRSGIASFNNEPSSADCGGNYRDDSSGSSVRKCLICNSDCNFDTVSGNYTSILSANLDAYFILKQVIELPSERLEVYLQSCCSEPGEWIRICQYCGKNYVTECRQIYMELATVIRKYDVAKLKLTEAIKRSLEEEEESSAEADGTKDGPPQDRCTILDICKDTRNFVRKYEYRHPTSNPFTSGDLLDGIKILKKRKRKGYNLISGNEGTRRKRVASQASGYTGKKDQSHKSHQPLKQKQNQDDSIGDFNISNVNPEDECCDAAGSPLSFADNPASPISCAEETCDISSVKYEPFEHNDQRDEEELINCKVANTTKTSNHKRKVKQQRSEDDDWDVNDVCESSEESHYESDDENQKRKKKDNPKSLKCTDCGWDAVSVQSLKEHRKRAHGNEQDLLDRTCPICKKVMASKRHRRRHIARCHSDSKIRQQCEHCDKNFVDKYHLLLHMGKAHNIKDQLNYHCPVEGCEEAFPIKSKLEQHLDHHNTSGFKCDICGKNMRTRKTLRLHAETHKNEGNLPFCCAMCPARFLKNYSLTLHMKNVHDPKKVLMKKHDRKIVIAKCPQCDATFRFYKQLREHMERVHAVKTVEDGVFPCTICQRVYKLRASLIQHIETIHEKKYQSCCEICGKISLSKSNMKKHKLLVHSGPAQDQKYKLVPTLACTVEGCSKKFTRKDMLRTHIKRRHEGHRPFQCEHCGKGFATTAYVKRHVLAVHTNQETKPFKCDNCGKDFAIEEYLLQHKRKHCTKQEEQCKLMLDTTDCVKTEESIVYDDDQE